jgi:hypothetical protein
MQHLCQGWSSSANRNSWNVDLWSVSTSIRIINKAHQGITLTSHNFTFYIASNLSNYCSDIYADSPNIVIIFISSRFIRNMILISTLSLNYSFEAYIYELGLICKFLLHRCNHDLDLWYSEQSTYVCFDHLYPDSDIFTAIQFTSCST